MKAQELEKHQWKNRIVLILSNDKESELVKSQLKEFDGKSAGLKERKLIIYQVLPNSYRILNSGNKEWISGSELYQKYNTKSYDFRVVLIGLDGEEKLQQDEVLTTEKLFSVIDSMPMRRAEIRNDDN